MSLVSELRKTTKSRVGRGREKNGNKHQV